jgi:agmatine deiminase
VSIAARLLRPFVESLEGRQLLSRSVGKGVEAELSLPRNLTDAERAYIRANPAPAQTGRAPSAAPAGPIDSVAEYEAMEGLVISWVGSSSWLTILAQISRRVTVEGNSRMYIGVPNASAQSSATASLNIQGANLANVTFFTVALNSIWARDYGPRYVFEGDAGSQVRVIADHDYNRPRPSDDDQPIVFAALKKQQYYEMGINGTTLIHGGGNYHLAADGDAYATSLITDENPSLTAAQVKAVWQTYQGNNTTITGEFPLSVDATGHIDMWMQIYADKKVFISDWPTASGSTQDQICDTTATLMQSRGYEVTRLPAYSIGGTHYTFANMVIVNDVVLLPQYNNGPGATISTQVKNQVQAAFGAGKTVYAINADPIVTSAGVFHCIVQHVPKHRGAAGANGGLAPTAFVSGTVAGQTYLPGQIIDLKWITDDDAPLAATGGVQSVDVQLSTDGGATYPTTLATGRPALGTFSWTVPAGIDTSAARIRVVAHDSVGNLGSDAVNADFTIGSPTQLDAPLAPQLSAASDTGTSDIDRITRLNNASPAAQLLFTVHGTVPGATVSLFADGVFIGSGVAVGTTLGVTTNGATALADGDYVITATQSMPGRPTSAASFEGTFSIDTVAPTLLASTFEFESEQRVVITADEAVALGGGSVTLVDRATGEPRPDVALTITPRFDGTDGLVVRGTSALIPDGDWTLTVASAIDVAGNASTTPFAADFFVLAGDINRDRAVDFADLVVLAQNYNTTARTWSAGNLNYDSEGKVDFADLVILAQNYGHTLPALPPSLASAVPVKTGRRSTAAALLS